MTGRAGGRPARGSRVLVTGFEAFDREPVNPSWEAARALDGWQFGADRADDSKLGAGDRRPEEGGVVTVHARCMPCVFGDALKRLAEEIDALEPSLVLAVGQAGGRIGISVERVAINIDDGRIADNAGRQPIDTPVVAGGPPAYFATLPIKAIVRDLRHAGIPASVSNTAGTFVCNHLFYGLMHGLAAAQPMAMAMASAGAHPPPVRGGFIHIPFLPEQAVRHPGQPSMALTTVIDALRIAVATAWAVRQDITETGGTLS